jgi:hypothetical protein
VEIVGERAKADATVKQFEQRQRGEQKVLQDCEAAAKLLEEEFEARI